MAKKNKDQEPQANLNSVTNRDILQRLNFLYQASAYLHTIAPSPSGKPSNDKVIELSKEQKRERRRKARHPAQTTELARAYVRSMKIISQKATVRMDPNVKRTLCKKCNTILMPGSTASVRTKPSSTHGHSIAYTCVTCGTTRRIPAPPILDADKPPRGQSSAPDFPPAPPQADDEAMQADALNPQLDSGPESAYKSSSSPRKHRKRRISPRVPPLFQRKGHVVFRGNVRLLEDD
ncbi:uncharacterized protein FIBRA_00707 [Fibroporia radiculosa]|uniref:Rpr2-domain-containing protein n=1 Tax=Fibroporia radiculosa TaxID=599839 RepID=J4G0K1_9APHY|nr:uncharacterized protein FIBRA_00707 [Fibroporia radiculosa]CCL98703.1 predicted protein [Fibroporia radiculosa]